MADVIAWSKLNKINKKTDIIKAGIDGTSSNVDFLIDGVQQVKTDLKDNKETIETMNTKMDKMVEDVHTEIQADPSGVPAPHMAVFNTATSRDGIKVDYTVNVGIGQGGQVPSTSGNYNYPLVAVTKGVMVRYSSTHFPTNREDGDLAFIDEDVLTTQANGQLSAKTKSQVVTGNMVMNNYYYFTAFPFSNYNVYNEQMGTNNCKKEQYVGDVGTVKVNVSADMIVRPLNYTITLAGEGKSYTEKGSGNGAVTFTGVKPGTYNVTANAVSGYAAPSKQSVTLAGGQTKTVSMQYRNNVTFASATWSDIDAIGKSGKASSVFNLHDTKNITCNGGKTVTLEIVGFNHDDLQKGGKAPITLAMKHLMKDYRVMNSGNTNSGGFPGSEMYKWLNGALFNSLPADLRAVIKPVNKKTSAGGGSSTINTNAMKMWLFSEREVGLNNYSVSGEGYVYPIFTSNSSRIKYLSNGSGGAYSWWLRSPLSGYSTAFCNVDSDGSANNGFAGGSRGVAFGFCV